MPYPIYLQVCAGLANRLRATVSGLCAAEDLSRSIVISWPREAVFGATWSDLFEDISGVTFRDVDYNAHGLRMCLSPEDWARESKLESITIKSYGHFHNTDPERWLKWLRRIKPLKPVAPLDAVGVHIRRTDNRKSIQESPTKAFFKAMDSTDTMFFVATDDLVERSALVHRYPGRLLPRATLQLDRDTLAGVQGALQDFLSLAACRQILGSVGSSFSEMAAAYGGCPLLYIRDLEH